MVVFNGECAVYEQKANENVSVTKFFIVFCILLKRQSNLNENIRSYTKTNVIPNKMVVIFNNLI